MKSRNSDELHLSSSKLYERSILRSIPSEPITEAERIRAADLPAQRAPQCSCEVGMGLARGRGHVSPCSTASSTDDVDAPALRLSQDLAIRFLFQITPESHPPLADTLLEGFLNPLDLRERLRGPRGVRDRRSRWQRRRAPHARGDRRCH